jgi:phosphohistidine phosphatase
MAILQVLRHAQAQSFAARDHDRPLTTDGAANARAVGRVLAVTGVPDRVLVSTSRRTRQTLDEAMQAGGWSADVVPVDALYGGGPTEVLDVLAARAGDRPSVLVVGHEPWCSGVVGLLTGAQVSMSAAALATLQVGPGWDALDPGWCTLTSFIPAWLAGRLEPAVRN